MKIMMRKRKKNLKKRKVLASRLIQKNVKLKKRGKRGKYAGRPAPRSTAGKTKQDFRKVQSAFWAKHHSWLLENQELVALWERSNLAAQDCDIYWLLDHQELASNLEGCDVTERDEGADCSNTQQKGEDSPDTLTSSDVSI